MRGVASSGRVGGISGQSMFLRAHLVYLTQPCDVGHMTSDHFSKMG